MLQPFGYVSSTCLAPLYPLPKSHRLQSWGTFWHCWIVTGRDPQSLALLQSVRASAAFAL